ncbi:hypothetical protein GGI25_004886 [Coemansia spiralis]|uniref:SWI/SNF and RSC complexes subunit Ssr4 C-terminal domain-containing protein n=1 Tax=Coemansia spiralis TaxID=417178 RepID=A0A9W8KWQ4_9FUNG|nr:hypothetical protein BX070DRAFT_217892 [Coemansia spiralis]KAJ2672905.1 hypothetical protein GGI25_004886 [Coemansia spiralis]
MSGPPQQTPNRYMPNAQLMARPGQSSMMQLTPQQQQQQQQQQQMRPNMMQLRPGIPMTQQQLYMANRGVPGSVTPQQHAQYAQHMQQQMLQQHMNAQMRPGIVHPQIANVRPNIPQQQQQQFIHPGTASIAVAGVGVQGHQPHPSLVQPQTPTQQGRKRKGKAISDAVPIDDGAGSGDELDNLQPYSISLARYQNNHNLMSEVFIALPTSTINVPKPYYENLSADQLTQELDKSAVSFEESEKEHEGRIGALKREREEFSGLIKSLVESTPEQLDEIKRNLESHFAMEFVNSPYRTVERIPIDNIDGVEDAIYKQL